MPLHDVPADRLAQRERAVEIGETLGQVERTALGGELGHAGEDGGADIRQLAGEHTALLLTDASSEDSRSLVKSRSRALEA
ncbi:hypothetical protein D3C76_1348580 [compost metagenome]